MIYKQLSEKNGWTMDEILNLTPEQIQFYLKDPPIMSFRDRKEMEQHFGR